jgi:hypothetical protein
MVRYEVWTKVERMAPGRFLARAVATPCGVEQRCAPEERTIECVSLAAARVAGKRLAAQLRRDIVARGNVALEEPPPVSRIRAPALALESGGHHGDR